MADEEMNGGESEGCECVKNPTEDELEKAHFKKIITAFKCYKKYSLKRLSNTEEFFHSLPEEHRNLLINYETHLQQVRVAIEHNYEIIKLIIKDVDGLFENVNRSSNTDDDKFHPPTTYDMDKVQSTIKQFVRDWAEEGKEERLVCYQPIIDELVNLYPPDKIRSETIKVLVPGAGLGRLAYEIAKLGYVCQGNEFSLFVLFASNFILNKCADTNIYRIYPWVHQYCNNLKSEDQIRPATFPDVDPTDLPPNSQFSMAAGDFLEIYTESHTWDSVVTCFFLDTANNVVTYVETIWNILKPGGYWINFGPLLYHYADIPKENSIEPSYEMLSLLIKKAGFIFKKEETDIPASYSQNPRSMLRYQYRCVYFVCQKPS